MRLTHCITLGAFFLAGLLAHSFTANAFPISSTAYGSGLENDAPSRSLVHKVSGCHRDREYHMVYLWGYPAWHRHRSNCAPVAANPPSGGGYYCHRNWENHYHRGSGTGWHKHVGQNCVVRQGSQWRGGPKTGCIKLGGIWICG